MTYSRKLWRHQCLHFTSAQDFPTAHPVSGKSHSSGVWLNPTNLRCDHHRCWWDIIRIHRATYCTGKMYISTQAHTNMHSLFTLGSFSCGSTVIIWWFRLVPGGGCEAPHVKQWKKDRWYRPWMVCLTSATHKQKWYFSRDEGAICVKADRDTHTQKKKKQERWGQRTLYHTLTSSSGLSSVCQTLISAAQIPENKQARWHGEMTPGGSDCKTRGL